MAEIMGFCSNECELFASRYQKLQATFGSLVPQLHAPGPQRVNQLLPEMWAGIMWQRYLCPGDIPCALHSVVHNSSQSIFLFLMTRAFADFDHYANLYLSSGTPEAVAHQFIDIGASICPDSSKSVAFEFLNEISVERVRHG